MILPNVRRGSALRLAAALVALLGLGACGTKGAADPLAPPGPVGRVRFVNVITDTTRGRVNVALEGVPFDAGITYAQTAPARLAAPSTALYASVLAGARTFVLKRTADTSVTVATLAFTMAADEDRTVYATGGAGGGAVTAFTTADTNSAPATGQVRVRVVHLAPAAGAVDVFVTAPGADLAAATPAVAGLAVRGVSAYLLLAAGTYQVRVVPAGTAPAARAGAVAINVASLALTAGTGRTIVAAENNVGGAPLRAFVLADR